MQPPIDLALHRSTRSNTSGPCASILGCSADQGAHALNRTGPSSVDAILWSSLRNHWGRGKSKVPTNRRSTTQTQNPSVRAMLMPRGVWGAHPRAAESRSHSTGHIAMVTEHWSQSTGHRAIASRDQASSAFTGSPSPPILNGRPLGAKRSSSSGNPAAAAIVLLNSETET